MRPAWAITWWWKSATGLAVGTVSRRQGCPKRFGIWRKPEANSRTDEQELHTRLNRNGRVCATKQSPILHEFHTVNTAVTWEEGYSSYPGRSHGRGNSVEKDSSWEVSRSHSSFHGNEGLNNLKSWRTRRCRHRRLNTENHRGTCRRGDYPWRDTLETEGYIGGCRDVAWIWRNKMVST